MTQHYNKHLMYKKERNSTSQKMSKSRSLNLGKALPNPTHNLLPITLLHMMSKAEISTRDLDVKSEKRTCEMTSLAFNCLPSATTN